MLNNPDPLYQPNEATMTDEGEPPALDLAIKLNNSAGDYECALCGDERVSSAGPELYIADSSEMVCHECGREHAPLLVALIDLGGAAEGYAAVGWSNHEQTGEPHGE
ncbi:MAG: hypothetical protein ACRD68_00360 [Pyrinomonadaceae bacterium]